MKDKAWLINELVEHEIGDYGNSYNSGYDDAIAYALVLAHQLNEPEKHYYIKFSETQYAQWFDEAELDLMLVNSEAFAGVFTEREIEQINPHLMFLAVEVRE